MSEEGPRTTIANRISSGTSIRTILLLIFMGGLVMLAWQLSDVLLLFFGAIIVAVALRIVATPLERHLQISPAVAVGLTVVTIAAVISFGIWLVGDRLVEQVDDLRERLPEAYLALTRWARGHPFGVSLLKLWKGTTVEDVPWASVAILASHIVNAVSSVSLMVVVGIYLAINPRLYREGVVRLVPTGYRGRIDDAMQASASALAKWLMAQGISMLFVGLSTAIGLYLLGMPAALTLGVIAGVLAFIPFFGPIASGILAILLAFMEGPTQALYVTGLCVAIQQVEGNLLEPFIQQWAVAMPPVLGITAAVIFGLLFGLPGIILATPLMVVALVLLRKLYVEAILEGSPAVPPGPTPY